MNAGRWVGCGALVASLALVLIAVTHAGATWDPQKWDWVAGGTLGLAFATIALGVITRRQVTQTHELERARRSELAISQGNPIAAWLDRPWLVLDPDTSMNLLKVRLKNVGESAVWAIQATLRSNDVTESQTIGRDALAPGQQYVLTYRLGPAFTGGATGQPVRHLELVLESRGLLNQRVIQNYRFHLDEAVLPNADADQSWYQERLQIVPGPGGAHSTDITFVR